MSPRPRTIDDADILAAMGRLIERVGPRKLTLALIAKEAGLAPATLVQRFGSKTGMLRALANYGRADVQMFIDALRGRHLSPFERVREYALCLADLAGSHKAYVHNLLAYLELDLGDPVLYKGTLGAAQESEAAMTQLIEEAGQAGEIAIDDPRRLARVLNALSAGSLLAWATRREGKARAWLERDVDTVLAAFRPHQ